MPNPSGYPAFVWLLRRSCPSEGNTSAAAHRTAASLWLRSNLRRCTSEPTPHLHAPPAAAMFIEVTSDMHIRNKLFPQLGSRDVEFLNHCTQQHQRRPAEADQEIFAAPACPAGICHDEVRPLFGWVTSPPKNVRSSGQQMSWHRVERAFFLRHGEQTTMGLAFDSRMLKLKMKSRRGRAGRHRGARVSRRLRAFPIWGIHIQTKSTFICGFNGVGGGGAGTRAPVPAKKKKKEKKGKNECF